MIKIENKVKTLYVIFVIINSKNENDNRKLTKQHPLSRLVNTTLYYRSKIFSATNLQQRETEYIF